MKNPIIDNTAFLEEYGEFMMEELQILTPSLRASNDRDLHKLLNIGARAAAFLRAIKIYCSKKVESGALRLSDHTDLLDLVKDDTGYSPKRIEEVIIRAESSRSSFGPDSQHHRRLVTLNTQFGLRQVSPIINGQKQVNFAEETAVCANTIINDEFSKHNTREIHDLMRRMFARILDTVKNTAQSENTALIVHDLERFINVLSEYQVRGKGSSILNLQKLRKESFPKNNTICHQCQLKPIARKGKQDRCKSYENLVCYKSRYRTSTKDEKWTKAGLRCNGTCQNCSRIANSLDHVHSVGETSYLFCSKKCYATFRKRVQRMGLKK